MFDKKVKTTSGEPVLSPEEIDKLRNSRPEKTIFSQQGCQERFLSAEADIIIFGGKRGGSKAQPYDSNVFTPFGFRKMGDLKVGDIVSNPVTGGMERIIQVHEHGERDVYRVNFSDGTHTECVDDHLWLIKRTNYVHKTRYLNGTGQDADWRIWTFAEIMKFLDRQKNGELRTNENKSNLLVPLCAPLSITRQWRNKKKIEFDPYIIGAILGDGCVVKRGNLFTITSEDVEVVEEFAKAGVYYYRSTQKQDNNATDYYYNDPKVLKFIKDIGLWGKVAINKSIPAELKYSTVEERFALVQGMMDTDGMADIRGHCSYATISKQLAEDMAFVLRSLGAYVTISKNPAGYKDEDGNYVECNEVYNLYIKIIDSERLFRLPRKKERCRAFNGGVSTPSKRIVDYEYVGKKKCRCITVDDRNGLYCTDDFTVTHNSFSLLMETLYDVYTPNFSGIILRNERNDLDSLVKVSEEEIYGDLGDYNRSKDLMRWSFPSGASLRFSYHAGAIEDFKKRFQGQQYAYIGVDEITQMSYDKFKYLLTCNRNAYGIKNRFVGTCNPDKSSWVYTFIRQWLDNDGCPKPEMDGVIRYCWMDGETVDTIYWGKTKEEVYEQCPELIDNAWDPVYEEIGLTKFDLITSVAFIVGKLEDNRILLKSDPSYLARLSQQGYEQQLRDLKGCWDYLEKGVDKIKIPMMEKFFTNSANTEDHTLYISADIAFEGGDFAVMWLWEGMHIKDLYVFTGNSNEVESRFKAKVLEWGVRDENVVFDYWGVGQAIAGHMPRSVKFKGTEKPAPPFDKSYKTVKAQCAELLVHAFQDEEISIEPDLLDRRFNGKKGKYQNKKLSDILMQERKCIQQKDNSIFEGFELINKEGMIKAVGYSPDFFESLIYRMWFEIHKKKSHKPKGILSYTNSSGTSRRLLPGALLRVSYS